MNNINNEAPMEALAYHMITRDTLKFQPQVFITQAIEGMKDYWRQHPEDFETQYEEFKTYINQLLEDSGVEQDDHIRI